MLEASAPEECLLPERGSNSTRCTAARRLRAQIDSSRTKIERLLYVRLLQRTFLSKLRGRILEEHFLLDVFGKA